jgi:hypothetical protein
MLGQSHACVIGNFAQAACGEVQDFVPIAHEKGVA